MTTLRQRRARRLWRSWRSDLIVAAVGAAVLTVLALVLHGWGAS
jgi:hypothetical protein